MATVNVNVDDMQLANGVDAIDADRATEVRRDRRADGELIELHLTGDNAAEFDKIRAEAFAPLQSWHAAGTVVPEPSATSGRSRGSRSGSARSGGSTTSADRERNKQVRDDLREMGASELSDRGRTPDDLLAAHAAGDRDAVKAWNDKQLAAKAAKAAREADGA